MNDRVLVEALRAADPGALAALYDSYAESIYRYCWSLLLSTDSAQVALRDTLIAAEAHAGALADPDRLRPWLYALARGECVRRRLSAPPGADEALAEAPRLDDPDDADLRIMAWNATQSLPAGDREVLELAVRHDLSASDVATVLGVPPRQVEAAEEEARERLRDAITAEFLARKGPYDCARRARILAGFSGELTGEMREQLVRHVTHCETCSPHRTRQVSAAKVFELLPVVSPPESLRVRVMSCAIDPELVPYRRYVARRTAALDTSGFPVPGEKKVRRWPQAVAGALAAVATVIAIGLVFQQFGSVNRGLPGVATGAFPATGEPPAVRLPWRPDPQDSTVMVEPILDSTDTHPIGVIGATGPAAATPPVAGPTREPVTQGPATRPAATPTRKPTATAGPTSPGGVPGGGEPTKAPQGHPTRTPCPTTPAPTPTTPPAPTVTPTQPPPQPPAEPSPPTVTPTPPGDPSPATS